MQSSPPTPERSPPGSRARSRRAEVRCSRCRERWRRWQTDCPTRSPRRSRIPAGSAWPSSATAHSRCSWESLPAVKYQLPIKVVIIKNNTLGMIKWEQMVFLGNPEYGCDLQAIDFAAFARACGGTGFTVEDPAECERTLAAAMATP